MWCCLATSSHPDLSLLLAQHPVNMKISLCCAMGSCEYQNLSLLLFSKWVTLRSVSTIVSAVAMEVCYCHDNLYTKSSLVRSVSCCMATSTHPDIALLLPGKLETKSNLCCFHGNLWISRQSCCCYSNMWITCYLSASLSVATPRSISAVALTERTRTSLEIFTLAITYVR